MLHLQMSVHSYLLDIKLLNLGKAGHAVFAYQYFKINININGHL
jgi:hypothetical protein